MNILYISSYPYSDKLHLFEFKYYNYPNKHDAFGSDALPELY